MVRFTHPEMFYLLIPFVLVSVWYAISGRNLRAKMESLGTEQVRKFLLNRVKFSRVKLRSYLLISGILFIILASAGPQIGTKLTQLNRKGVDVIIALDTSTSMDAIDVSPSRIEKAKHELSRFINVLDGDRVGLIVFAGSAHLHCPLTSDYSAARLFLNSVVSKIIATLDFRLICLQKILQKQKPTDNTQCLHNLPMTTLQLHRTTTLLSIQTKKQKKWIHLFSKKLIQRLPFRE